MDNKITVYNENNELEEVEVIDFFQLDEFNHEYVLYTKNEIQGDNVITYVSILHEISENEYQFEKITDPEEEKKVDEEIQNEIDLLINE